MLLLPKTSGRLALRQDRLCACMCVMGALEYNMGRTDHERIAEVAMKLQGEPDFGDWVDALLDGDVKDRYERDEEKMDVPQDADECGILADGTSWYLRMSSTPCAFSLGTQATHLGFEGARPTPQSQQIVVKFRNAKDTPLSYDVYYPMPRGVGWRKFSLGQVQFIGIHDGWVYYAKQPTPGSSWSVLATNVSPDSGLAAPPETRQLLVVPNIDQAWAGEGWVVVAEHTSAATGHRYPLTSVLLDDATEFAASLQHKPLALAHHQDPVSGQYRWLVKIKGFFVEHDADPAFENATDSLAVLTDRSNGYCNLTAVYGGGAWWYTHHHSVTGNWKTGLFRNGTLVDTMDGILPAPRAVDGVVLILPSDPHVPGRVLKAYSNAGVSLRFEPNGFDYSQSLKLHSDASLNTWPYVLLRDGALAKCTVRNAIKVRCTVQNTTTVRCVPSTLLKKGEYVRALKPYDDEFVLVFVAARVTKGERLVLLSRHNDVFVTSITTDEGSFVDAYVVHFGGQTCLFGVVELERSSRYVVRGPRSRRYGMVYRKVIDLHVEGRELVFCGEKRDGVRRVCWQIRH